MGCRPIFDFKFWGQMTHKVKIFENVFSDAATGHGNTFRDQIWWKSAVAKFPKDHLVYHTKTDFIFSHPVLYMSTNYATTFAEIGLLERNPNPNPNPSH